MTIKSRMHQLHAPWMAWWLVWALVVAPALGRMHEVLHAPALPHAHVASTHSHADKHVHDAFGAHSQLECLVFDQLGHGSNHTPAIALIAYALPNAVPVWISDATALPQAPAAFEARAPPRVNA